ncbi:hypothetical protein XELAEV_18022125mg [Xenopus laevis]|uniref:Uncharacterized protein n=1 Tax=Xenopus laevis TaxID=8355 RepID=A0A974HMX4_XENLA|nr:hypothetical protein XELAEV_18022125mg [Xenopus laevis]
MELATCWILDASHMAPEYLYCILNKTSFNNRRLLRYLCSIPAITEGDLIVLNFICGNVNYFSYMPLYQHYWALPKI